MDLALLNRTVVITGATANIGHATALEFAREGARLVLAGRDTDAGARLVELALQHGAQSAEFFAADMLDAETPTRLAHTAGEIDVLVNNLGGNVAGGLFAGSDPATWQGDIDITLMTTIRMTHCVLPGMIRGPRRDRECRIDSGHRSRLPACALFGRKGCRARLYEGDSEGSRTVRRPGQCGRPFGTIPRDPHA